MLCFEAPSELEASLYPILGEQNYHDEDDDSHNNADGDAPYGRCILGNN